MRQKFLVVSIFVFFVSGASLAENIRGIDIDFVTIGNAGNPGDTRPEAYPSGCGAVDYNYYIGKYEITNDQWNAFVDAAGAPTGNPSSAYDENASYTDPNQPTNKVSWYEAAQFCNYLTSGDKSLGAYELGTDGSITVDRSSAVSAYGVIYVLPTIDEWYKAAYYKPDGSGYSTYANGEESVPSADNGWNYYGGAYSSPWDVGTGTMEQNSTFDMMGNVWEWNETVFDVIPNCGFRGGSYSINYYPGDTTYLSSSGTIDGIQAYRDETYVGFRVVRGLTPIEWVYIEDPGNDADDTGYGSVDYEYLIGKYEVTNEQYCEFLNAIATTDTYSLYEETGYYNDGGMSGAFGGIRRSSPPAPYSYSVKDPNWPNKPVNYVNFYDCLRFANWLHNGQPVGSQNASTTEDGAYTLTGLNSVDTGNHPIHGVNGRNANAKVWLTSEDEWYKAAYYKGGGTNAGYWDYATKSDTVSAAEFPPGGSNSANYNNVVGAVTDVGSYTSSISGYGTFDQGGNVWEWNETDEQGIWRIKRGAAFDVSGNFLPASYRNGDVPTTHINNKGFRVVKRGPMNWHVDCNGSDANNGRSKAKAFATIQKGIDAASDGDTVLVWPCVYDLALPLDFDGKAITVKSADDPATIRNATGYAFDFFHAEGPDSVLENVLLTGGKYAIQANIGCAPTLRNLTVADNEFGIACYENADPNIINCIFYNNSGGDLASCEAKYSWVEEQVQPVAYWKFDEPNGLTAYDSVGSNDGALTNGPVRTTGMVNGALSFDGDDDYVEVPYASELGLTDNITITAWVKRQDIQELSPILEKSTGPNGDSNYNFYISSLGEQGSNLTFVFWTGTWHLGISNARIVNTLWHHVAATYDRTQICLYIDGALDSCTPETAAMVNSNEPVLIGFKPTAWPFAYSHDLIDEVAIYGRALTSEEIEQIYENGLAGFGQGEPLFGDSAGGDYHLRSEKGRYVAVDPNMFGGMTGLWAFDAVSSPCVDGGDPKDSPLGERDGGGGRINMGAYGGTAYASLSDWALAGDINRDGEVNIADFAIVAEDWLGKLAWKE